MARYCNRASQAWGMPVEKLAGLADAKPYLEYDAAARWAVTGAREHCNGRMQINSANNIGQPQANLIASRSRAHEPRSPRIF